MSDEKRPETVEELHANYLTGRIEDIAAGLERLAERVRWAGKRVDKVGTPGNSTYAAIAVEVVHEITWGVANLHIDRPAQDAAAADVARAKGE